MKIGCVKEIKNHEYRVGMIPTAANEYIKAGHMVFLQSGAGRELGISDDEYASVGVKVLPDAESVWAAADMMIKVKEPLEQEYNLMREGQIIYTYFHFAASEKLTQVCLEKKIIAVAYETVQDKFGLPLLKPMSEVAGSMAPLMGAYFMMKSKNGCGILPTGVPGVLPANIMVLGGGIVGRCAARVAAGLGAQVTILDNNIHVLTELRAIMPSNVFTVYSNSNVIDSMVQSADMIIGAVLIPGARAPKLICRPHLAKMKKGSVLVDVAIDQGGCFETSHPTTHDDPVYEVGGVIHYCVANMPGAYARTSTMSLNNSTLGYGLQIANKGIKQACKDNVDLLKGLNMFEGKITYLAVAQAFDLMGRYADPGSVI